MQSLTTLFLKLPRNTEVTPEAAQNFLAALTQINTVSFWQKLTGIRPQALALEIALVNQQIKFLITSDSELVPFIETQLQSNYPLVIIEKIIDPILSQKLDVNSLLLKHGSNYPIATHEFFKEVDPLSSVLSVLSKSDPDQLVLIQFALEAIDNSWQSSVQAKIDRGFKNPDGSYSALPDQNIIKEKISYPGFKTSIRLASQSKQILRELVSSFGVFSRPDGNGFASKSQNIFFNRNSLKNLMTRTVAENQILNIKELATLWHLPSEKIKILNIAWGTSVLSEPPDNLPISIEATDDQKQNINFFAKTTFKNRETIFGIKNDDRRRHIWMIGKTGTGKSTLISNMAIDDLKKGRGMGVIDPHGDLCDTILDYIPASRINDVVYFNPADRDFPIIINSLEVKNKEESELVVSGLMSIFTKIWVGVWSARMEYILRNSFLTLTEIENSTMADVIPLLSTKSYRDKIVAKVTDPVLKSFWLDEYEKMPPNLQKEANSAILNKVGQFATSPLVRRIIGSPKSSIQVDSIMNEGKILLADLSSGRLGEDNSTLLGAMLITKIQLAAMNRVNMPESARRDFYLYVDEFQNFATTSFIKILSEARKYRLNLMLANQYMAQIPPEIQKAILGNTGTLVSFAVGAEDAQILHKEFAEVLNPNDLVNLSRHQIAVKLTIDGFITRPFLATTLPLPLSRNKNREKVIRVSRERWALHHPIT